jgi:hypothetical protein
MRIVPDSPGNKSKDLARSTSPAHAGHQSPDRLLALEDEQELRQRLDLWHHPASRSFSSKVLTGLVYSLPEQAVYTSAENDKAERQISLASSNGRRGWSVARVRRAIRGDHKPMLTAKRSAFNDTNQAPSGPPPPRHSPVSPLTRARLVARGLVALLWILLQACL